MYTNSKELATGNQKVLEETQQKLTGALQSNQEYEAMQNEYRIALLKCKKLETEVESLKKDLEIANTLLNDQNTKNGKLRSEYQKAVGTMKEDLENANMKIKE